MYLYFPLYSLKENLYNSLKLVHTDCFIGNLSNKTELHCFSHFFCPLLYTLHNDDCIHVTQAAPT